MTETVETETGGRPVVFAHEATERLRVAVLGTSGHAFRNYLPVLPFVAVEYVAQWDPDRARARAFARQFGAGGDAGYDDVDRPAAGAGPRGGVDRHGRDWRRTGGQSSRG